MSWVSSTKSNTIKRKTGLLVNEVTLSVFCFFLLLLLLPWSFLPIAAHHSLLLSRLTLQQFCFLTLYFSLPLSVIKRWWCTCIHLECAHSTQAHKHTSTQAHKHTILTDVLYSWGKTNVFGLNQKSSLTGFALSCGCRGRKRVRQTKLE